MSTRSISFAVGEFYHVYNRGTDKRTIFAEDVDYHRFLERLYLCNSTKSLDIREVRLVHENVFAYDRGETLVSIGAYCLMPNHFHILITPKTETGLGIFMNKLGTSYTMYFNKRNERTGSLFEGTYKAKHADTDNYLKYLYAYIHLNPAKLQSGKDEEEVFASLKDYPYSSLPVYLGAVRPENNILETRAFPEYFTNHFDMEADLLEWISFDQPEG